VRTADNTHIIVPNSAFLEKNVLNWTLSNNTIRVPVSVGVAYGSSTRDVARLLRRAVEEHGQVLEKPEPMVRFEEFGDNSLNFAVLFWIQAKTISDRWKIQSDIRFRIDSLFREAQISIAFPQRDVHLDTANPVDIRLLTRDTESESHA